jgi:2-C-methyl-D-erythritol 4-phosphate cytidylyltransferase/2-C-methyl-D-erythritol 2,4-cyclodiphosphate synthase
MTVTALIVAAGKGERLGGDVPKQYRTIGGKPVLRWAVEAMASSASIDQIRVVVGSGQQEMAEAALEGLDVGDLVEGGAERSDSVLNGLHAIGDGTVLVHDAARPFCPPAVVERLLSALEGHDGAVPVLPVADTIALGGAILESSVDRKHLLRVQTPQAFHVEDLIYAYEEAGRASATDESTVMLAAGLKVATVEGDPMLEKLTTPADWDRAEAILARG